MQLVSLCDGNPNEGKRCTRVCLALGPRGSRGRVKGPKGQKAKSFWCGVWVADRKCAVHGPQTPVFSTSKLVARDVGEC